LRQELFRFPVKFCRYFMNPVFPAAAGTLQPYLPAPSNDLKPVAAMIALHVFPS
jgi:hypothetical protein